jgi:hypothetical protein
MPTTRRRLRRGRLTLTLSPALMDYLLDGRTRAPAEVPAELADTYDHFLEFDPWTPGQVVELWAAHGPALLAEWDRRGGAGLPWAARLCQEHAR